MIRFTGFTNANLWSVYQKTVSDVNEMKNPNRRIVLLNKESSGGECVLFPEILRNEQLRELLSFAGF